MRTEHPIILQRRFGISDTRFLLVSIELFAAGCFLICAEAAALVRLSMAVYDVTLLWWARFLGPVVVLVLGVLLWTSWRKRVAVRRGSCLEVELNLTRHNKFLEWAEGLLRRSELNRRVELRYLPWRDDANAYVTKQRDVFFITVTRGLVKLYEISPQQAEAIVSHEISHIEADDIRFTNVAREGAEIAIVIIAGMNAALLVVYLVQVLVFGNSDNGLPVAGALLTSAIAPIGGLVYYREYLLGREFMHDLRAVQLMNLSAPMEAYLSRLKTGGGCQSLWSRIRLLFQHFRAFHPTPDARLRNLSRLDPYRGWGFITPIFAGAFLALLPIQLALARAALQFPEEWLKMGEWGLLAVTTVLLLKSDLSRLSVYTIHRDRVAIRIPAFFVLVLLGSFLAVFPFIALASAVRGRSLLASLQYASNGVVWTAIGYSGAAAILAYVWGVSFLSKPRVWKAVLGSVYQLFSLATIVFFLLITLSRGETAFPLLPALVFWIILSLLLGALCIVCGGCVDCGVRSWNALYLKNTCSFCRNARIPKSVLNVVTAEHIAI
jgi:Zn-dependent protease with chaperone function